MNQDHHAALSAVEGFLSLTTHVADDYMFWTSPDGARVTFGDVRALVHLANDE